MSLSRGVCFEHFQGPVPYTGNCRDGTWGGTRAPPLTSWAQCPLPTQEWQNGQVLHRRQLNHLNQSPQPRYLGNSAQQPPLRPSGRDLDSAVSGREVLWLSPKRGVWEVTFPTEEPTAGRLRACSPMSESVNGMSRALSRSCWYTLPNNQTLTKEGCLVFSGTTLKG